MKQVAISLNNITKTYQDGTSIKHVLQNISLRVNKGELIAIVGPSGSGKTTLLSIIGLLLTPSGGKLQIGDTTIHQKSQKELTIYRRNHIGFIFQSHHLLPYLTGHEQLKLLKSKTNSDVDIDCLVKELDLSACIYQYPAKMSGGEKQRVAIARAFVCNPDVILADEPTASLDKSRGRTVVEMIRKETTLRNKATIMVTHDERMLDLADHIYHLEDGILTKVNQE